MSVKFTKTHEWIKTEGGTAFIGISNYAQEHLSDIVFVELPKVGAKLAAGKMIATVESVKAVSDVYVPVSGTVVDVNKRLESAPELLNQNAMENWIVKIEFVDAGELDALMDEAAYEEFCKNEE